MNESPMSAPGRRLRSLILLVGLVAVILSSGRGQTSPTTDLISGLFYMAVFCVAGWLIGARRRWLTVYLSLALPAFLFRVSLDAFGSSPRLLFLDSLFNLILMGMLVYLVFEFSLFETHVRELDRIIAGICGYLILGLFWATLYHLYEIVAPGGFTTGNGTTVSIEDGGLVYYSLVTLSTLGYGDITPVAPMTRILSALEAVAGTLYLAVFISSLVSGMRGARAA